MIVVEGVSRALDPDFDMWKTSEPVVREWIERNLGPTGALAHAAAGAGELGRLVAGFPALASRAASLLARADELTRDGIVLSPKTIMALGERNTRGGRWRTLALWVIALSLAGLLLVVR
jgi:ubiquinone biosynthesis protein